MSISASALRYFVALAEEQHFARTAERMHITPPSLSQQIARLEKSMGRVLFDGSPRGVQLTAAGEELLPLAREAVRAHTLVEDWARDQPEMLPPLRVGIVASGAGNLTAARSPPSSSGIPRFACGSCDWGSSTRTPPSRATPSTSP